MLLLNTLFGELTSNRTDELHSRLLIDKMRRGLDDETPFVKIRLSSCINVPKFPVAIYSTRHVEIPSGKYFNIRKPDPIMNRPNCYW